MNVGVGWVLAVLAIAIGYASYGWQGVVLGVTVIVFWLLLQFSRVLRVLRQAGQAPVGQVGSAVMLHSKLHNGMKLLEILPLTRSLGRKLADEPETFAWSDDYGDRVVIEMKGGRLSRAVLERAAAAGAAADGADPAATPVAAAAAPAPAPADGQPGPGRP